MVTKPLVSVIIPVYNVEKYLRECLDSIVNQIYENIEVVCVNDGSTDNSSLILEQYRDLYPSRIKIITQKNKGLPATRNTGLEHMTGEYCLFVDSDDFIKSTTVSDTIEKAIEFNCDLVYFKGSHYNTEGGITAPMYPHIHAKFPAHSTLVTNQDLWISGITNAVLALYKKDFLKNNNIRFIEGLFCEDWPFMMEVLSKSQKIFWLNDFYYFYRSNPNSLSQTISDFHITLFDSIKKAKNVLVEANLWQYHAQLQDYLMVSYTFGFFLSKLGVMSRQQRVEWCHRIKELFMSYTPTYRTWLWCSIGKPRLVLWICQDKNWQLALYAFLSPLRVLDILNGMISDVKLLLHTCIDIILIPIIGLKIIRLLFLKRWGEIKTHVRHILNIIRAVLTLPLLLFNMMIKGLKIGAKIGMKILKRR